MPSQLLMPIRPEWIAVPFGMMIGSFLNVCIFRLPRNLSVVWPPSACPKCSKKIAWYDNIPVLSFLILGARCRNCKDGISPRYPLVEALGGFAAFWAIHWWGATPYGYMAAALFFAFIAVTFIDLEHEIIPDEITLSGIALGAVFSVIFPAWHGTREHLPGLVSSLIGVLVGGGILLAMGMVGEKIFKKEAMGGGDVKFLAAFGAFFGWQGALLSLFIASFAGAIFGIAIRIATGKDRIPFGPYLVIGCVVYMLWGKDIISWYFHSVLQY